MNISTPHQPIFREYLGIPYKSRRLISDPHYLEYVDHVEMKIRTYVRPQSSAKVEESDGIDSGDRDYFIARSISLTVRRRRALCLWISIQYKAFRQEAWGTEHSSNACGKKVSKDFDVTAPVTKGDNSDPWIQWRPCRSSLSKCSDIKNMPLCADGV